MAAQCDTCIHEDKGLSEPPCFNCNGHTHYEDARGVEEYPEPPRTAVATDTQVGGSHYQLPIQPIDYIVKNGISYREGNAIKYITRHKDKNGAEDIKKAIHYLQMILEEYES